MVEPESSQEEFPQENDLSKQPGPRLVIPEEPEAADYDAEIAAIFSHESAELLESADLALEAWKSEKGSGTHIQALKRQLHTLKGGARMAGIKAMSNLSHEIEALLINIDDGRIQSSTGITQLLQESIDELHRMRDTVIAGKAVISNTALQMRIHEISLSQVELDTAGPILEDKTKDVDESELPVLRTNSDEIFDTEISATELNDGFAERTGPEGRTKQTESGHKVEEFADPAHEFARIDARILEDLLNATGEISIYHSRLTQKMN
jgi:chemosensory pili system protein ChpA (sensor histidine kinase/response regulator)